MIEQEGDVYTAGHEFSRSRRNILNSPTRTAFELRKIQEERERARARAEQQASALRDRQLTQKQKQRDFALDYTFLRGEEQSRQAAREGGYYSAEPEEISRRVPPAESMGERVPALDGDDNFRPPPVAPLKTSPHATVHKGGPLSKDGSAKKKDPKEVAMEENTRAIKEAQEEVLRLAGMAPEKEEDLIMHDGYRYGAEGGFLSFFGGLWGGRTVMLLGGYSMF